eukprot:Nk52_evm13s298 gene=Nk52_evmTU13s298
MDEIVNYRRRRSSGLKRKASPSRCGERVDDAEVKYPEAVVGNISEYVPKAGIAVGHLVSKSKGVNVNHEDILIDTELCIARGKAAVLVPIFFYEQNVYVLLTRRSSKLKSHSGEVCFPGGKQDKEDGDDVIKTALREAQEEIGLNPESVKASCNLLVS